MFCFTRKAVTPFLVRAKSEAAQASTRAQPSIAALASKQFPAKNASEKKIESLKRRERRLKRMITRDVNNWRQQAIKRKPFAVDPVLGDPENQFVQRMKNEISEPSNLAYGFDRSEFEKLLYGAQKAAMDRSVGWDLETETITEMEEKKRKALLTILSLRNTNAADKRKQAIAFARKEFQRFDGDTGLSEVQAAVLTAKIQMGFDHVRTAPKDKHHIQVIREMVQHRQKVLKYLRKENPERYFHTIEKLGLTDDVVTLEFSMSKQYFQDYKVWGDKTLVRLSAKQQKKEQKYVDLQKKVAEFEKLAKKNEALLNV